ncbi:MAG: tryptophan-rich sensory protein [Pseudomonadota bacterium]|nr:tryptophan-rich sensory protein [Pseudomonadota bacterium]
MTAAAAAVFIAILGGAATDVGPWYYGLIKPSWQPPDWLFAPVWTAIYGLTAVAGVLTWNRIVDRERRFRLMALFALNALLNVLWSELFFGLKRPDWSMAEVVPFWLSVLALVLVVFPITRRGGWALVPYLVWVLFAGILNLAIVRLNGPFRA